MKEGPEDLVCVRTFLNRAEAELAAGLLEANQIRSMIAGDDCGGMHPGMPTLTGGIRLLVRSSDLKKAKQLV